MLQIDACLEWDVEPSIYTYNSCLDVLRKLEKCCSKPLDIIYPPGLPFEFSRMKIAPQQELVRPNPTSDITDDFDKQLRFMPSELRVTVCHNPNNRSISGIHFIEKSGSNSSFCDCIHCYLQNAFPRNVVKKVLAVYAPSTAFNRIPKSFSLTMEEYQKIRNESYRLSLVLLNRIGDKWQISGDRPRIWVNRVDINFIQVRI